LVLGLDILNARETLVGTFELLLTALDFIDELCFILAELLDGVLHLVHLAGLSVDDISDALLDVLLLRVSVQIARDRVKEFKGLLTGSTKFAFSTKHVEQFSAGLGDLSGQLTGGLEVVELG